MIETRTREGSNGTETIIATGFQKPQAQSMIPAGFGQDISTGPFEIIASKKQIVVSRCIINNFGESASFADAMAEAILASGIE